MLLNELHPLKTLLPISRMLSFQITSVRAEQPLKAELSISLIDAGISMEDNEEQSDNKLEEIELSWDGSLMAVNEEQPLKAEFSMIVTLSGIVMEVNEEQLLKAQPSMVVTLSGIVTDVKELHSVNIQLAMDVALERMDVDVNDWQESNMEFPKVSMFLGNTMLVSPLLEKQFEPM